VIDGAHEGGGPFVRAVIDQRLNGHAAGGECGKIRIEPGRRVPRVVEGSSLAL
jgi:hypothetical protein